MPPQFPSYHRGMTANPLKPVKRYRPGKALAEEPSSEEEENDEEEIAKEEERRRQEEAKRRQARQAPPKATSFPGSAAGKIAKGVQDVTLDEDEEGFVTEEDEEEEQRAPATVAKPSMSQKPAVAAQASVTEEESEEESEEEESSEEESSEDEAPKRVLLRPTFIKKDKRKGNDENGDKTSAPGVADTAAESEARRAQRQEKADFLVRDQLEKDAMARLAGKKAWDEDENVAAEEEALDDRDGLDPEAEYAAWKLRELKRIKRQREVIEAAEKEREEIERRRNLNPEEREREDQEFIQKQKEEKEAGRGQTGYMQRYFHKGAFFRDDLEREGLDKRNIMGARFADETNREILPEYMQIRDMTKLGKKGRTKYRDLRSEDTGRWGEGFDRPRRPRDDKVMNVTDERFMPDHDRGRADDGRERSAAAATGANSSSVREDRRRRRSYSRRRSRSRSYSPRRRDYKRDDSRGRYRDDHRDDRDRRDQRKRSHSPYDNQEKRRRTEGETLRQ